MDCRVLKPECVFKNNIFICACGHLPPPREYNTYLLVRDICNKYLLKFEIHLE